jgi:hypothetical protein
VLRCVDLLRERELDFREVDLRFWAMGDNLESGDGVIR